MIEAIASMVIITILGSTTAFVLFNAMDRATRAAITAQLHAELSIAINRIDHELRNVRARSGTQGLPEITSVTATSMQWNSNWSLSLSGAQVMLVENGNPSAVLLNNVTSFQIQTYDESNTGLPASLSGSACDPIRRVSVQATMTRNGVSETLRCKTFLRCTMELAGS